MMQSELIKNEGSQAYQAEKQDTHWVHPILDCNRDKPLLDCDEIQAKKCEIRPRPQSPVIEVP